jgi:hypothetical protein
VNYSYNVALAPLQPGHDGGKKLDRAETLADLRSRSAQRPADRRAPNQALGYVERLPGFALRRRR